MVVESDVRSFDDFEVFQFDFLACFCGEVGDEF